MNLKDFKPGVYGCHNSPREEGYWVQDGHIMETHDGLTLRVAKMVWIEDRMEPACQYRHGVNDVRCKGCGK